MASIVGLGDLEVRDRFGHRFTVPQAGSPVGLELLISEVYEPMELNLVRGWLGPGRTFVEVGANIGCYSLPAADIVSPRGRVLAIEASPMIQPYLDRNIEINDAHNIEVVRLAAGEYEGSVAFHEAPSGSFGMGSRAPQFGRPPVLVPMAPLDSVLAERGIKRIDAIKVDVEGFELGVFRGAEATLRKNSPPLVLFEFLDWAEARAGIGDIGAAQEVLMDWGYSLWTAPAYAEHSSPLAAPLRSGGAMIVATMT